MRENGFRAIGGLAQRLTAGVTPKGGKSRDAPLAKLKAEWAAIVGPELARVSRPEALLASRAKRGAAAAGKILRLRVSSAASLEIQHTEPLIVERVNGYFGHRFIDALRLVQGTIVQAPVRRVLPAPDPATTARIADRVADVKDPELKAALARLGARIAASRRSVLLGSLGTLMLGRSSRAQELSNDQVKALELRPDDHVLGRADAPHVIVDYFSLTCPHCANFHAAILPGLRQQWIDPGTVKFVYRHFPSDRIATHASEFAECGGAAKFFDTIGTLFGAQVDWLTAADPEAEIAKLLQKTGMAADKCLADDPFLDKIVNDVQSGQALGVRFTPTLFINGRNYSNPGSVEAIAKILGESTR
jgi:protein-disulfide isomerase